MTRVGSFLRDGLEGGFRAIMSEQIQPELLSEIQLLRLQELKRQWYEADTQIRVKLNWVIETQEKIEDEILEIVLGVKE